MPPAPLCSYLLISFAFMFFILKYSLLDECLSLNANKHRNQSPQGDCQKQATAVLPTDGISSSASLINPLQWLLGELVARERGAPYCQPLAQCCINILQGCYFNRLRRHLLGLFCTQFRNASLQQGAQ
jgi:hypothetical protein